MTTGLGHGFPKPQGRFCNPGPRPPLRGRRPQNRILPRELSELDREPKNGDKFSGFSGVLELKNQRETVGEENEAGRWINQEGKFDRGADKLRESGSGKEMRGGKVKPFWILESRRGGGGGRRS
jgi:hypothetical protein